MGLEPGSNDHARALEILRAHGWNATSFQVLEPGVDYWFDGSDACVAYVDTGRAWVVAGAPIVAEDRMGEVARRFEEEARRRGRRVRYFATEDRFHQRIRLSRLRIGEQPVWDPAEWEETLRASASLREQLRRSRAKGVRVRLVPAEEIVEPDGEVRQAIDRLITRWMRAKQMAPMGFLVAVHPFSFSSERRYFVAERAGAVVGFLAAVPVYARGGWLFEDLLRDPQAPNGTTELLVDAAMRTIAAEGSRYATLGLAPLAGASGWLLAAARLTRRLYDFGGLRRFKARLRPSRWEPIYLAWPEGEGEILPLVDSLAAFARGGLLRFGLETLLRGPTIVIEGLAVGLVPWTLLLASASVPRWFPTAAAKWAWVGFDVGLCVGLFALTRRWRPRLATAIATAVTADAALTWIQALVHNAPRIEGPLEAAVTAAGVLAPTVAAPLLWRARWHRQAVTAPVEEGANRPART
ncbi:DUF2156 domain-containing protein [Vulgatibacter incomptus]|uniref:Phosphatidylglycerol lysyltransferase C-terminal domain-containing protein n=1 Tax=Vulgatibacter incomptus TaxID=1391653 RepID=A0A0K1PGN1_9BACT|nr:DUF2156 domain-containing protein [Vulgatibacter incomptus]AKU92259.1 hypothetical protein AKJ08_2646 [Vulgatibacter incomptus]